MLHRRPPEMAIPIETNASEIEFNQRVKRNFGERTFGLSIWIRNSILDLSKPQHVLRPAIVDNRLVTSRF